jgi:hypothetical protein
VIFQGRALIRDVPLQISQLLNIQFAYARAPFNGGFISEISPYRARKRDNSRGATSVFVCPRGSVCDISILFDILLAAEIRAVRDSMKIALSQLIACSSPAIGSGFYLRPTFRRILCLTTPPE